MLGCRVRNVTDGVTPPGGSNHRTDSPSGKDRVTFVFVTELTAGKNYEIQARNANSSFTIGSNGTNGEKVRAIVG